MRFAFGIEVSTITRPQGEGDEAYFTYVEEADDAANKVSRRKRIGMTNLDIKSLLSYSFKG